MLRLRLGANGCNCVKLHRRPTHALCENLESCTTLLDAASGAITPCISTPLVIIWICQSRCIGFTGVLNKCQEILQPPVDQLDF